MNVIVALEPRREVLPNGLTLIVHESRAVPTVAVSGCLKGGAMVDAPETSGLANLTAQMLRRGTKNRTALDIASALDFMGASISFGASNERTNFSVSCLKPHLRECLTLLSDMLMNPTFPQEELEKEKAKTVAELKDELTRPFEVSWRKFLELAYPKEHPFHYDPSGTPETIERLSRAQCEQLHQKHYHPQSVIMAVAGDVDAEETVQMMGEVFSSWGDVRAANQPEVPDAPLPPQTVRESVSLPGKVQCDIRMGHRGVRRTDPKFYPCNVLSIVLGGPWGRLFNEIRDNQGLAYYVYAWMRSGLGEGPLMMGMGVNPQNVDKAIESAITEVRKVQEQAPTEEEVQDAKSYLLGQLMLSLETHSGIAEFLLNCELYGLGMDYLKRARDFYDPITPEQVQRTAQEMIHLDKLAISIAGP